MFDGIVAEIICSQFQTTLGYNRVEATPVNAAMQVKFRLDVDYEKEDGYRNLTVLIYNAGMRYTGVYAKLDWKVIAIGNLTDEPDPRVKKGKGYVDGETQWVLLGYHDSCWRDAVETVLRKYRDRISHMDTLFNGKTGWYKELLLTEEQHNELYDVRQQTPGYGSAVNALAERIKLEDLDFQFQGAAE